MVQSNRYLSSFVRRICFVRYHFEMPFAQTVLWRIFLHWRGGCLHGHRATCLAAWTSSTLQHRSSPWRWTRMPRRIRQELGAAPGESSL
jgi:hypothetical protein